MTDDRTDAESSPPEQPASEQPTQGSPHEGEATQLSEHAVRGGLHAEVISFEPVVDPTSDVPTSTPGEAQTSPGAPSPSEGSASADSTDD
jgi:hypothetical protein